MDKREHRLWAVYLQVFNRRSLTFLVSAIPIFPQNLFLVLDIILGRSSPGQGIESRVLSGDGCTLVGGNIEGRIVV